MATALDTATIYPAENKPQCDNKGYVTDISTILVDSAAISDTGTKPLLSDRLCGPHSFLSVGYKRFFVRIKAVSA
jgi:hypothetical protein